MYAGSHKNGDIRKMDVYFPPIQRDDRACVVLLHGGGFAEGGRNDDWSVKSANTLAERGFVVFSIDYRLGMNNADMVRENFSLFKFHNMMEYCIRLAVEDLGLALGAIFEHEKELNVDRDKIVLAGSSAGAITVLQFDFCRTNLALGHSHQRMFKWWRPAAVVAYSGGLMCGRRSFNMTFTCAPLLLFHGVEDRIVKPGRRICSLKRDFFGSAKIYEQLADDWSQMCWYYRFMDVGHEVSTLLPDTMDLFCEFVEQAFAGERNKRKVLVEYDSKVRPTE